MDDIKVREIYNVHRNVYYLVMYIEDEAVTRNKVYCMIARGEYDEIKDLLLESKECCFETPRSSWNYVGKVTTAEYKEALVNFKEAIYGSPKKR